MEDNTIAVQRSHQLLFFLLGWLLKKLLRPIMPVSENRNFITPDYINLSETTPEKKPTTFWMKNTRIFEQMYGFLQNRPFMEQILFLTFAMEVKGLVSSPLTINHRDTLKEDIYRFRSAKKRHDYCTANNFTLLSSLFRTNEYR